MELIIGTVNNDEIREIDYEIEEFSDEDKKIIKSLNIPLKNFPFQGFCLYNTELSDCVGIYIHSTYRYPHIIINMKFLREDSSSFQELKENLLITILHELYHGLEDLHDFEYNCDHAEQFATDYVFKNINIKEYLEEQGFDLNPL